MRLREDEREELSLVFIYLDRTPMRPRAENWFEVGGIGGIPELLSEEFGFLLSSPPLLSEFSTLGVSFMLLSSSPFWKTAVGGGGGKAASSAGRSAPSSTHRLSFSS